MARSRGRANTAPPKRRRRAVLSGRGCWPKWQESVPKRSVARGVKRISLKHEYADAMRHEAQEEECLHIEENPGRSVLYRIVPAVHGARERDGDHAVYRGFPDRGLRRLRRQHLLRVQPVQENQEE